MTAALEGPRTRFELDMDELPIFRWIFLVGVIVYPLYWFVQTRFQGQTDPLWIRLVVTGIIGLAGIGMTRSEWFMRHALAVAGGVLWLMTLHIFFLLWLNNISTAYIAGLIIIIAVMTVLGTYSLAMVRLSVYYYLTNFAVALTIIASVDAPKVSPAAFLLGLASLQGVAFIALRTRVNMVERLRESQRRYELAAAGSRDGLWDWNVRRDVFYFSPRWKTMMGYEPDAAVASLDDWLAHVVVEDRDRLRRMIDDNLESGSSHFECDFRAMSASGPRWMLSRAITLRGV
ncbi:MAG: PAS domain-containing protein, partial [Myxococcales bacterium]|nr:PAS domain-containing protein [Myxococcales bacterium]